MSDLVIRPADIEERKTSVSAKLSILSTWRLALVMSSQSK